MLEPIFLQAVLQDKIWGGQKLKSEFGFELPSETVGEAWCISAHPNGVSRVLSPAAYEGFGLDQLYQQEPALFGGHPAGAVFPLLVKILDAKTPLSVQVHPDDTYALEHEGELGKTECWYVMDADPGATIIYGHRATSRPMFEQLVAEGCWEELLVEVPVKAGDFFDVPAGTIHAIGAGVLILETQQSSDTTYRVYDYDRVDDQGNRRPLHLNQSADVTLYPDPERRLAIQETQVGQSHLTQFVSNDFFTVTKWEVEDRLDLSLTARYTLATVMEGEGQLIVGEKTYALTPATSFILPHGLHEIRLEGRLSVMTSSPN